MNNNVTYLTPSLYQEHNSSGFAFLFQESCHVPVTPQNGYLVHNYNVDYTFYMFFIICYLTLRPWSIAHSASPHGLLTRGPNEGEGSNCFSITQLVGQERQ